MWGRAGVDFTEVLSLAHFTVNLHDADEGDLLPGYQCQSQTEAEVKAPSKSPECTQGEYEGICGVRGLIKTLKGRLPRCLAAQSREILSFLH